MICIIIYNIYFIFIKCIYMFNIYMYYYTYIHIIYKNNYMYIYIINLLKKKTQKTYIELLKQQSYFANCFCMKKEIIINCMLSFVVEVTQTIKES